jgi:hypothetical protein
LEERYGADRGGVVRLVQFLGVLLSSGAVALGIISLLPVELILFGGAPPILMARPCESYSRDVV